MHLKEDRETRRHVGTSQWDDRVSIVKLNLSTEITAVNTPKQSLLTLVMFVCSHESAILPGTFLSVTFLMVSTLMGHDMRLPMASGMPIVSASAVRDARPLVRSAGAVVPPKSNHGVLQ
jgi:hypothetical protein